MKILNKISVHASVLAVFILFFSSVSTLAADNTKTLKTPKVLPEFTLNDQYGNEFTQEQLKGKWSMIFVGFASCPDVCPYTLANLEAVRADMGFRLRPDSIPNIVFLSVDPDRDKPMLKEYLHYYHPDYVGITGERNEINTLIKGLDAYYRLDRKSPLDLFYNVIHSANVAVINPDAQIVAQISPPFKPHSTGEYLIKLIRGID